MKQIFFLLLLVFFFSGCKKVNPELLNQIEGKWECTNVKNYKIAKYNNYNPVDEEIFLRIKKNKLIYEGFGKTKVLRIIKLEVHELSLDYIRYSMRTIDIGGEIREFSLVYNSINKFLYGAIHLKSTDYVNENIYNNYKYPDDDNLKYQNSFIFKKV